MIGWWRRLLGRERQTSAPPPQEPVGGNGEVLDAIQKAARAQARLTARIESIESKLEAGFADLRAQINARPATGAASAVTPRWDDLLDAVDLLEAAAAALDDGEREAASGLQSVLARVDRFLAHNGLDRVRAPAQLTDGKLFRVVGTEIRADLPAGAVVRLVRAAVVDGERVVREGEVTINRQLERNDE